MVSLASLLSLLILKPNKLEVAWNGINGEMISNIDVLAAIDDAIKDGVDVISISIGGGGGAVNYADINEDTLFGIGSFHAVSYAWNEDTYKAEIFSEGTGGDFADPFDFGGGICNPNGAADPGLIYDMEKNDYSNYLCSLGYSYDRVYNVTTYYSDKKNSTSSAGIVCPKVVPSRLDMNLPSISIPNLKDSVTIKRTVTNVGNINSIYKLVVKPPRNVAIKVTPDVLKFNAKTKKISFKVKITSTHQRSGKFTFGSLAWSDGKHFVRIPIAVRKQVDE
ncbi:putative ethylene-responsive transcription factor ESR2-like [Capsicum annuum]|nr:putative ethylene-responsive transcription factor ESR2-like [Capsicum annuum]